MACLGPAAPRRGAGAAWACSGGAETGIALPSLASFNITRGERIHLAAFVASAAPSAEVLLVTVYKVF